MCLGTLTCSKCGKEIDPNYDHECMSAEMLLHRAYPLLENYVEYIDGWHHPKHVALVHKLVQDIKELLVRSLHERMRQQDEELLQQAVAEDEKAAREYAMCEEVLKHNKVPLDPLARPGWLKEIVDATLELRDQAKEE